MDHLDWHMARAALQWQAELGVSDAVGDVPIDRYDVSGAKPKTCPLRLRRKPGATRVADLPAAAMAVRRLPIRLLVAEAAAAAAEDLPALKLHCKIFRIATYAAGRVIWYLAGARPAPG